MSVLIPDTTTTDGIVPYDGIPIKEFVAVALPVTVVYVFLASIGMIFACMCMSGLQLHLPKEKVSYL